MNRYNKKYFYILILIIFSICTHIEWYNFSSILTQGDWYYWPDEVIKILYKSWGTWIPFGGLGTVNIQLPFNFFMGLWSIVANLGFSFDTAVKLTFFIPISLLLFLSPFFLILKLTKNYFASFISALFYATTTYGVANQLPIQFVYSITPFIILVFINTLEKNKIINWIYFTLIYALGVFYEIRITYIVSFILIFYFIYFYRNDTKKYIKNFLVFSIISILLNIFWIVPILTSGFSKEIAQVANRGLFGNNLFSISQALTIFSSNWTGAKPNMFFEPQPVLVFFWIIPIFLATSLLNLKYKREKNFFWSLAIIGIFLTKQSSPPLSQVYEWLYYHFPGFNLFREASKFYIITSLAYMGILGYQISYLIQTKNIFRNKILLYITSISFILLAIINSTPLITGSIGSVFVKRTFPNDYLILKNILTKDREYSRVLFIPTISRWGFYNENHPRVSNSDLLHTSLKNINFIDQDKRIIEPKYEYEAMFSQELAEFLLNSASIKYFVIPIIDVKNDDDFMKDYTDDRDFFVNILDKLTYLSPLKTGAESLVIYKNDKYLPHIRAIDSLLEFASTAELNQKYLFVKDTIELPFDFIISDTSTTTFPTTKIYNLFEKISTKNLTENKISEEIISQENQQNLYINLGKKNISYYLKGDKLLITSESINSLQINGEYPEINNNEKILNIIDINLNDKYYASIGSQLIPINPTTIKTNLGEIEDSFDIVSIKNNENLIKNGSFEDGLWQNEVGDCNNADDNSIVSMSTTTDASAGKQALALSATTHIACTGPDNVLVENNKKYLLSFDYKSLNAQSAGYYIGYNIGTSTSYSERLQILNDSWESLSRVITIPDSADQMGLVVYSYSTDLKTEITTKYDNFTLLRLNTVATIKLNYSPTFKEFTVKNSNNFSFIYYDKQYDSTNIINNPSFEDGLWQKEVGDCNNYDDNGVLGMTLSNKSSSGTKSLEISAKTHIACTSNTIYLKDKRRYLLSFDYQSENAKEAGYYISFNDKNHTVTSLRLPIKNKDWNTYTKQINIPDGATAANLVVYSYATDGITNVVNHYDNFSLNELPNIDNSYYFINKKKIALSKPLITFEIYSPTKRKLNIKEASNGFYIAMSEAYHPKWQAELNNKSVNGFFKSWIPWVSADKIADDKHFQLDGFLNGWYVDPEELCINENGEQRLGCVMNDDGSYNIEMIIEFTPQRWFYAGLLISGMTLAGCIFYLLYDFTRRRRLDKSEKWATRNTTEENTRS